MKNSIPGAPYAHAPIAIPPTASTPIARPPAAIRPMASPPTAVCLVEMVTPVGGGAPYHVHRADDETFYVLEGQLEFISGERRMNGGPGSSVFLPRSIPHGFRVVGTAPARFLVFSAPSGFDEFVTEAGVPATSLTLPAPSAPDMAKLKSLAAKYHIETLGPLPV